MSFPLFDVFISLWRTAERKLKVYCCFLSFWSFMTKSTLSVDIEKQYLHKVSLEICFLLTCFHQRLRCHKFWYNEKIKNSYWTTVTNTSPFIRHNPSWWWHVMFWHCTFFIAVNLILCETIQRYFWDYKMCVKLPAMQNVQLEYVLYTWGNA